MDLMKKTSQKINKIGVIQQLQWNNIWIGTSLALKVTMDVLTMIQPIQITIPLRDIL